MGVLEREGDLQKLMILVSSIFIIIKYITPFYVGYCNRLTYLYHNTSYTNITAPDGYKWKKVEKNKRKMVHSIDKIDNFQDLGPPLLRWRASMEGPCHGAMMAGRCI